jgi:hypothetical protein
LYDGHGSIFPAGSHFRKVTRERRRTGTVRGILKDIFHLSQLGLQYTAMQILPSGLSVNENRKLPRLDLSHQGQLDLRISGGGRITLPISITSVSPHGVSVIMARPKHLPAQDSLVTLRFSDEELEFTLPARVAWIRSQTQSAGLGLEFLFDLTPADMSQRYARWVVDTFKNASK